jgi:hypothetical protein
MEVQKQSGLIFIYDNLNFFFRGPDEDITPMDTNNTPLVDVQGPISAHAQDN